VVLLLWFLRTGSLKTRRYRRKKKSAGRTSWTISAETLKYFDQQHPGTSAARRLSEDATRSIYLQASRSERLRVTNHPEW